MYGLPWMTNFLSRARPYGNDFHLRPRHTSELLVNNNRKYRFRATQYLRRSVKELYIIFYHESCCISNQLLLSSDPTDDRAALFYIIAMRSTGDKLLTQLLVIQFAVSVWHQNATMNEVTNNHTEWYVGVTTTACTELGVMIQSIKHSQDPMLVYLVSVDNKDPWE